MRSLRSNLSPAIRAIVLVAISASVAPLFGAVFDGGTPQYPIDRPIIQQNGDAPSSFKLPIYSAAPPAAGLEGGGLPEPTSIALALVAGSWFGLYRPRRAKSQMQ